MIGANIQKYREMHSYSQAYVAEQLSISLQKLQSYESGTSPIPPGVVDTVSSVLKVSREKFFEGVEL